jgi:glutamate dehydrogenase/leucine dehydrogenase
MLTNFQIVQTMAWIFDEYSKFHGHSPAVVTGKPIVSKREGCKNCSQFISRTWN